MPQQEEKKDMLKAPAAAFTHGGKFHADDVFSAALLRIVYPNLPISRGFELPPEFDGLVFDIGGGEFDHHGPHGPVRENGVPYAAFGLLWRALGPGLLGQEEADRFDETFIQPLDLDDNTGCGSALAAAIGSFNPVWDSDADADERFWQAEAFAQQILSNRIEQILADQRAKNLVEQAFSQQKDGIAVLPCFAPWKRVAKQWPKIQFVIYPSQRGGYAAQAASLPGGEPGQLKCPFPAAWAGLRDEQAARVSGIKTLRFCHNSRFMITAETCEDAKEACYAAKRQAACRLPVGGSFGPKAVVCDCDGTVASVLLHEASFETICQLQRARQQGAIVMVATGRILPVVPQNLRQLADYCVCGNGALAAGRGQTILFKDEWTKEQTEQLTAFCNATGGALSFYFEADYGIYSGYEKFWEFYKVHLGRTDCMTLCPGQDRHLTELPYGAFYIGSDKALADYLASHPDLQAAPFMPGYYDIYKKSTNKAKMIGRVLEYAQVSWNETLAFGDGSNDVEMLAAAGLGYAMENGRDSAKMAADAIAPSVAENGVAQVLQALYDPLQTDDKE